MEARINKEHIFTDLDNIMTNNAPPIVGFTFEVDSVVQTLTLMKCNVNILKRVPKGARTTVAQKLSQI